MPRVRAAIYVRTAPGRPPAAPGAEEQRQQLLAYARARGYEVVGEFVDQDVPPSVAEPPQLRWLLSAAALGGLDVVLTASPERLAPGRDALVELVARLARYGVDVAYPWMMR